MTLSLAQLPVIAYFSMEFALEPGIPTYSGGLGVLAGDMMRSAADLGVPLVGVTLVSRAGHFAQRIAGGSQVEEPQPWEPARHAQRLPAKVLVEVGERDVWVGAWRYEVASRCRDMGAAQVILLDTDLPENRPEDRELTHWLYGGDEAYRLKQEIVLGVGGVRMLAALALRVQRYHLNEGHAALLALELLRVQGVTGTDPAKLQEAIAQVRRRCVFTTHTPVQAGHDQFPHALAESLLERIVPATLLRALDRQDRFNLTWLALRLSGWVNGVADRHAQTSRALFPGYDVHTISNGVHALTWTSEPLRTLFDRTVRNWAHEPELLVRALGIADADLLAAHAAARRTLFERVQAATGVRLDPARMTIGFARRMTSYKRPGLLFSDLERLRSIARRQPFQVVLAGKAHPRDVEGKRHIQQLHAWARELEGVVPVVFLPDYGMETARWLVAGVDLWLNTPQPPLEASGTSGMKAALNGVPSLSVLDGWWIEGWDEGVTGWAIGEDGSPPEQHAAALYDKLERVVLPLWHGDPAGWAQVMRSAIARNGSYFQSHRMLRRYASEAYWR